MNSGQESFIEAYGIDLRDAGYADPVQQHATSRGQQAPTARQFQRVDSAAQHALRGPHFTPAAPQQSPAAPTIWDAGAIMVDMNFGQIIEDEQPQAAAQAHHPAECAEANADCQQAAAEGVPQAAAPPADHVTPTQPSLVDQQIRAAAVANAVALQTSIAQETLSQEAPVEEAPLREPPVQETPQPAKLAPAWEVDRFRWPENVEQLFESRADYFDSAGKKLLAASQQGLKVLAITSARSGEGTTTTAMCLAPTFGASAQA